MLAVIGTTEYLLIAGAVLLLFGARRLPELGRSLGEGIKEFRKSSRTLIDDEEKEAEKPAAEQ
ncbi:MAG: twin-arginine translocase TatA/TatE family subunit [Armatimonadetes bacterium]|nr:twin-arginine translocase TatA/TatE family subunit [Armatimonadota bacterium]